MLKKITLSAIVALSLTASLGFASTLQNPYDCTNGVANYNNALQCDYQNSWGGNQTFPAGTYASTCSGCSLSNNTLTCNCDDGDGDSEPTSVANPYDCKNGVANYDGNLQCDTQRNWGGSSRFPAGTYSTTCSNCQLNSDLTSLSCDCQ